MARGSDDDRFRFVGFDLEDRQGGNSALVNCGGFLRVFDNRELSEHGLVTGHARAEQVRHALATHYAACDRPCLDDPADGTGWLTPADAGGDGRSGLASACWSWSEWQPFHSA